MRDKYFRAISHQAILNSGTGLTLISIGASTLLLAVTGGASQDVIASLGIGGAALFAGGTFLRSQQRQLIYVAGANAIACTLAVIEPMRVAQKSVEPFKENLDAFPALIRELSTEIVSLKPQNPNNPELLAAEEVLSEGAVVLKQGRAALVTVETSGGVVFNAVERIRGHVARALIDTERNLRALVNSLGASIPLTVGQLAPIAPDALPSVPSQPSTLADLNEPTVRAKLESLVKAVEDQIAKLVPFIDIVQSAPSPEILKSCEVNIEAAGLNFEVMPTSLAFDVGQTAVTSSIVVTGGQSPYEVNWISTRPPSGVNMTLSYSSTGTGIVTITIDLGTAPNVYSLLVKDASSASKIVAVHINSTTNALGDASGRTSSGTGRTTGNPTVFTIQSLLKIYAGFTGEIDGIMGTETLTAINKLIAPKKYTLENIDLNEALLDVQYKITPTIKTKPKTDQTIQNIQLFLNRCGRYNGDIDGIDTVELEKIYDKFLQDKGIEKTDIEKLDAVQKLEKMRAFGC